MGLIETTPRLETRRLTLRAPRLEDAPALAAFAGDLDVSRMTARMPHPYGLNDAHDWIAASAGQDPREETSFVVEHDDEGLVGAMGVFRGDEGAHEVGYWIAKPYWGRGYATEAVTALVGWAATAKRRRLLAAGHFEDNPASGAVLVKAGFLYTGVRTALYSRARNASAAVRRMVRLT